MMAPTNDACAYRIHSLVYDSVAHWVVWREVRLFSGCYYLVISNLEAFTYWDHLFADNLDEVSIWLYTFYVC